MQVGADLLRQGLVRDVPDQEMAEAEAVLAGERGRVGPDEVFANQSLEASAHRRRLSRHREVGNRPPPEHLAHHRGALQDVPVGLIQSVEPGSDDRMDRLRRADSREISMNDPPSVLSSQQTVVHQHPEHLLDEQGVTARALHDLPPDLLRP